MTTEQELTLKEIRVKLEKTRKQIEQLCYIMCIEAFLAWLLLLIIIIKR